MMDKKISAMFPPVFSLLGGVLDYDIPTRFWREPVPQIYNKTGLHFLQPFSENVISFSRF
jgi:hypothetical protein